MNLKKTNHERMTEIHDIIICIIISHVFQNVTFNTSNVTPYHIIIVNFVPQYF